MARIVLRIWSAIISTFAVMAAHSPANSAGTEVNTNVFAITAQRSKKPELFLEKSSMASEQNIIVAGHRSHSSHRSHASHRSSYGGYNYVTEPSPSNTTINSESSPTYKNVVPSKKNHSLPKEAPNQLIDTNSGASKIYLTAGGSLDCDYVWQDGDSVNVLIKGKVLKFNASEVNVQRTFSK